MSVRDNYHLACPSCGSDDTLHVSVPLWITLPPDGTDLADPQPHEWQDTSPCRCADCGFAGLVADFGLSPFTVILDVTSRYCIRVMARDAEDARHVAEDAWDAVPSDAEQINEEVIASDVIIAT